MNIFYIFEYGILFVNERTLIVIQIGSTNSACVYLYGCVYERVYRACVSVCVFFNQYKFV